MTWLTEEGREKGCDGRSERPPENLPPLHGWWGEHRRCGRRNEGPGQERHPFYTRWFVKKEGRKDRCRQNNSYGGYVWQQKRCVGVGQRRLAVKGTETPGREHRQGQAVGWDQGHWVAGVARVETKKKKKKGRRPRQLHSYILVRTYI